MFPLPHGAAWQTLFLICGFLLIEEIRSEARIVCYYTNWSVYRPGTAKFSPQNINPYLCTHLIYAFGGFTKDNTLKPFDKYQDIEQGGYAKFTGLKSYNKNLKTLLAIGGWNEGSSRFSPLMANPERRQQFIKNILKFLRQNHFDGLDLDWEYPAFRDGGKPRDRENYAQFVEELRAEFGREASKTGRPRLLLTMAVPAGIEYIDKGYDIPKLNKNLDWFNLLTYDYHSAYEPSVNHHSPLRSLEDDNEYNYDSDLNIDYTIKYYLNAGVDREKLVLGIPTYGRSYTLINELDTDIGSAADGPGDQGDATREKGYLAYYEICQALRDDPEWEIVQPNPQAMGPYAHKRNQWVGFDDENMVRKKAEYVVENGLGGIMFWSVDNDDFRGTCTGKPYPLIEAAKEAYLDRLGVGDNEVARPIRPKKPSRSRSRTGSASNRNKIPDDSYSEKTTNPPRKRVSNRRRTSATTTTTLAPTTSSSSLYIGGRSTTPPPPTTPDPGTDFKCEEEGFFPHPRDCKKYFWCLDSGPSNLGIVAHQFTCPSGLYFNTAADSCDFTRNVLCKKSTTTAKPTTLKVPTTTAATTTTTRSSPKVTAATSRSTFLRQTTSTTTTPEPDDDLDEEVYDDDEEERVDIRSKDSEEDPKVIKELIELIKKVGGLEELEKQLQLQEDGSMMLKNEKAQVSTTPSSISKSLYNKVLSRPNSLSSLRNRFGVGRSSTSSPKPNNDDSIETSTHIENKYSSVIRNSRPSPQNAGIEKLSEFEGFFKEKPKYVTISRTRPTQASSADASNKYDEIEDDDEDNEEDVKRTALLTERAGDFESPRPSTQTPSYVNIRRTRPTTAKTDNEFLNDATEKEPIVETTSRTTYQSISRRRGTTENSNTNEENTPQITSTYRYKIIDRTKASSQSNLEESITTSEDIKNHRHASGDEKTSSVTVQFSDLGQNTRSYSTQKLDTTTTRTYANIPRRTTTPPVFSTIVSEVTITTSPPELTTSQQPVTTPITISSTLLSSTSNGSSSPSPQISITPSGENYPKSTEHTLLNNEIHNENTLRPSTHHHHLSSDLDTEEYDTTILTDKNTDTSSHKTVYEKNDEIRSTARPNSRRPILSVRRRLTTTSPSPSSSLAASSLTTAAASLDTSTTYSSITPQTITTTNFNKYNRRTRPSFYQYSGSTTTNSTTNSPLNDLKTTQRIGNNDITKAIQKHVVRRKFGRPTGTTPNAGFRRTITTTSSPDDSAPTQQPRTSNPLFRRRHTLTTTIVPPTTKKDIATTVSPTIDSTDPSVLDEVDQEAKSSIHQDHKFTSNRYNQIGENLEDGLVDAIKAISKAPIPKTGSTTPQYVQKTTLLPENDFAIDNLTDAQPITRRIGTVHITSRKPIARRPQKVTTTTTTNSPSVAQQLKRRKLTTKTVGTFEKIKSREFSGRTYRPVIDYDYYDDEDVRLVGKANSQVKVILHGPGIIECLDQGNFPHPLSCRKFISCAKMETGGVVGWEYTCPKGLSYDPVGGICNWAAGLGCKE